MRDLGRRFRALTPLALAAPLSLSRCRVQAVHDRARCVFAQTGKTPLADGLHATFSWARDAGLDDATARGDAAPEFSLAFGLVPSNGTGAMRRRD